MGSNRNLVVTLANSGFVDQAKQLLSSVYWNAGWDGDYMLLAHQISEADLYWFESKGILVKRCEPILESEYDKEYPLVVLDKYYLFTEEFKKWDKIIYLDADIIVFNSLDWLTRVNQFSVVKDVYLKNQYYQLKNTEDAKCFDSKCNLNSKVFNSGVIAFDTKIITKNMFNDLVHLTKKYINYSNFGEQLILNLYFANWHKLPKTFNVFITQHLYKIPSLANPVLIHFFARFEKHDPTMKPVWNPDNKYYGKWSENLSKFNQINLKKRQEVKQLSDFKIRMDSFIISLDIIKVKMKIFVIDFFKLKEISRCIDRMIGHIGQFIKKRNERLYYKLKKIKGDKEK